MAKVIGKWENIAKIPAQKGFEKNIGTAGLLYGSIKDKIIVGGGANFPYKSVLEGGQKVSHKDIYLFEDDEKEGFKLLDQVQYKYPLSYGLNAQGEDKIFHIVKTADKKSAILEISVKDKKLNIDQIATLDFSIENGSAEFLNGKIYFGTGNIDDQPSDKFFSFDVNSKTLESLRDFPGGKRVQTLSFIAGGKIAVGGGADGENAICNLFSYNPDTNMWGKLKDIVIDGNFISVLGAQAVKINEDEVLIIGGFDKFVWKNAVHSLCTLTGEERQNFRKKYFTSPAEDFKWNKKMLIYSISQNKWSSIGELNFNPPCSNALVRVKNCVYSIMGEIKPGTRTDNVYKIEII